MAFESDDANSSGDPFVTWRSLAANSEADRTPHRSGDTADVVAGRNRDAVGWGFSAHEGYESELIGPGLERSI